MCVRLHYAFLPIAIIFAVFFNSVIGIGTNQSYRSDDEDPLNSVVSLLSQKVDQLSARAQTCEDEIAQLKDRVKAVEEPVSFTAFRRDAYGQVLVGQTIVFDTALTNVGGAYSTQTGFFTAPSPGTYAFFLHMVHSGIAEDNVKMEADVYVDNQATLRVTACCHGLSSGSNMVTVTLQEGQTVHVKNVYGTRFHATTHSSFSGYKLSVQ